MLGLPSLKTGERMNNLLQSLTKRKSFLLLIPAAVIAFLVPGNKKSLHKIVSNNSRIKPVIHPDAVQRQKKV